MSNNIIAAELEQTAVDLLEKYKAETDSFQLIENLHATIMQISQSAVDSANNTESYDDKISALVLGIQECVKFIAVQKQVLGAKKLKYVNQQEILKSIQTRVSDIDYVEEKKIKGQNK